MHSCVFDELSCWHCGIWRSVFPLIGHVGFYATCFSPFATIAQALLHTTVPKACWKRLVLSLVDLHDICSVAKGQVKPSNKNCGIWRSVFPLIRHVCFYAMFSYPAASLLAHSPHPLVAAPVPFDTNSWHTRRSPRAHALATCWAFLDLHTALKRNR